jgi:hypothetical protein
LRVEVGRVSPCPIRVFTCRRLPALSLSWDGGVVRRVGEQEKK